MRNFTGFGAPVMLFCHTPDYMGKPQWSDLGMWLQTIMLLLREEGLDTCPQEAWSAHGKVIRDQLVIPDDHVLGEVDPLKLPTERERHDQQSGGGPDRF